VWGFLQPFAIARYIGTSYADNNPRPFKISLISCEVKTAKSGRPTSVQSYNGPHVAPDYFLNEKPKEAFHLLMVPGGYGVTQILEGKDSALRKRVILWLKDMSHKPLLMTSVCTGAALLAKAGILDGKPAATNHQAFGWVSSYGPGVLWDNVSRWVDAGTCVTSAGVSAGTDMGFYLVSRLAGRAVAEVAAKASEYDWHRNPQAPIEYPQQAQVPSSR